MNLGIAQGHTKSWLYAQVDKCRQELNRNGITDITIHSICDEYPHISVNYMPMETSGLRGVVVLANSESPINAIIINSNLSEREQHFHSIHEYMHTCLHCNQPTKRFDCFETSTKKNQNPIIEWEANEGSAELLIPYRKFIPQFVQMLSDYKDHSDIWEMLCDGNSIIDIMADHYKVSNLVIRNRISSLSYEIDQFRQGVAMSDIRILSHNQQLSKGIQATDYLKLIGRIQCQYDFKPLDWDDVIAVEH